LRAIFEAPDISTARHILNLTLEVFSTKAPRAMDILEDGFRLQAVLSLSIRYRKRLRTTNGQERLNQEIRRWERVIRIFPNRESVLRRVRALLMEQYEAWQMRQEVLRDGGQFYRKIKDLTIEIDISPVSKCYPNGTFH